MSLCEMGEIHMHVLKVGKIKGPIECVCSTIAATIPGYADDHHANKCCFEIPEAAEKTLTKHKSVFLHSKTSIKILLNLK